MNSERQCLDFDIPVPIEGREGIALRVQLLVRGAALQAARLSSTWDGVHTAVTCNSGAFTDHSPKNVAVTGTWNIAFGEERKGQPLPLAGKIPSSIKINPAILGLINWATAIAGHAANRRGPLSDPTQRPIWVPGQVEKGDRVRFQLTSRAKGGAPKKGCWTPGGILYDGQLVLNCQTPFDFIKHRVVALQGKP